MSRSDLRKLGIIISGQTLTGRIEVIEGYLKDKTNSLIVLGYPGADSPEFGRCTVYQQGRFIRQKQMLLNRLRIRPNRFIQPLIFLSYILEVLSILYSALCLRRRFHVFLGVGSFATFTGLLLKKIGIVKFLIYYSIDYFPPSVGTFTADTLRAFDKLCTLSSDVVWVISPRIVESRCRYAGLPPDRYDHIIVPAGFDSRLLNRAALDGFDRWSIAFVGTLSRFHGLQLLVEALPLVLKQLPEVKVRLFGPGPWDDLKKLVTELKMQDRFIFMGFIRSEDELFKSVSRCAVGVAPYVNTLDNPAGFADPGKPKIYAFCGLPTIITKTPQVAYEIDKMRAGIAIDYDRDSLALALVKLLEDDVTLKEYRMSAIRFAQLYSAEQLFEKAFQKTLIIYYEKFVRTEPVSKLI